MARPKDRKEHRTQRIFEARTTDIMNASRRSHFLDEKHQWPFYAMLQRDTT